MATVSLTNPTVSGSDGTWGGTINTNFDTIENAFNGATLIEPALTEGGWEVGATTVTSTGAELNLLDGVTWTLTDLNGLTATVTELNYVDGVTSAIQTQLDNKQPLDATLTALAGLGTGANKVPYSTGSDAFGQLDFVDEDDMSSDSATALPSQQSVKAYVDGTMTLAGDGAADLPGGLQLRWGTKTSTTDAAEVFTFASAFSTGCFVVMTNRTDGGVEATFPVTANSTTGFTVDRATAVAGSQDFTYLAVGY